ncbi:acyl-CoA transferase [Rhodobacter sphaeroides]|uniref:acyl-CoA transferase n=1 Tax=Cereibacter sphaeroides TaxID=1063 RepID=UPI001326A668|nr:acyl-CoA transferase [Cereibacter sphaeroides]MWP39814.1 acyl-CoA transferase [Cereibacter sphaeroides]
MPTTRESILAALHARLQPLAALTLRDEVLPERIPASGLIILHDGQPGEPEVTLSPLRYHYQHRAELEVVVQAGTGRASAFDDLIAAIGAALETDRSLGGLCDWVEPDAPVSVDLPIDGSAALKAAVITLNLNYTTTGPLA